VPSLNCAVRFDYKNDTAEIAMQLLLQDAPELAPIYDKCAALGYRNAQQVAEAHAASPTSMENYLGMPHGDLTALLQPYLRPRLFSASFGAELAQSCALGALLDGAEQPMLAMMRPPGLAAQLPSRVSHIPEMPPITYQGDRGTCVAHAAAAIVERFWLLNQSSTDVSMQYLYWDCKNHDHNPDAKGTYVKTAMERLRNAGCCMKARWQYDGTVIHGNESHHPPPADALTEAPQYKIPYFNPVIAKSVVNLKAELADGKCIAFSIPAFREWLNNEETKDTGEILNPTPGADHAGGHAMCMVGYEDQPTATALGGGVFYIRNSWGAQWAPNSVLGLAGYGTIPYSYINALCVEAYSIG
jgi:hypothetical protein